MTERPFRALGRQLVAAIRDIPGAIATITGLEEYDRMAAGTGTDPDVARAILRWAEYNRRLATEAIQLGLTPAELEHIPPIADLLEPYALALAYGHDGETAAHIAAQALDTGHHTGTSPTAAVLRAILAHTGDQQHRADAASTAPPNPQTGATP